MNWPRYRTIVTDIGPTQNLASCQITCPVYADAATMSRSPRSICVKSWNCSIERRRLIGCPRERTEEHPLRPPEEWRRVRIIHVDFLAKIIIAEITHRRGLQAISGNASEAGT